MEDKRKRTTIEGISQREVVDIAVEAAQRVVKDASLNCALRHTAATKGLIKDTVRHTLTELGIEAADPLEMQRDFQHLRSWRRCGEEVRNKSLLVAVGVLVTGTISAIIVGLKSYFIN